MSSPTRPGHHVAPSHDGHEDATGAQLRPIIPRCWSFGRSKSGRREPFLAQLQAPDDEKPSLRHDERAISRSLNCRTRNARVPSPASGWRHQVASACRAIDDQPTESGGWRKQEIDKRCARGGGCLEGRARSAA